MHCLFSGLFVCYLRVSCTVYSLDCLFVTQESLALFVLWIVCLFRKSLAHGLFSGLFVCNARVSCTVSSLDCLFVTQESGALFFSQDCLFVTQESRALSILWMLCLLPKSLVHCLFSGLFVCYPRVSCTVRSLDCLFVSQESRARSVLWIVCLQCKSLVHCSFSGLFVCYPRVSCTVCSLDCYPRVSSTVCSLNCFLVSQGSSALFVLWMVRLWRESLAHGLFSGLFVCY